ncbi:NAD-dependent epimerase/dehydratase family protein [Cryptosporangium minutisporangium]|uniref:NAD-dependent epimerase/dehydratase family protein n=1 Tax=Cryptosporangium minutisporangium TaxID=113569 RepID=A0ABP6T9U8_9ACTN
MNVLVLGATGYIGSAVVDRLVHAGHRVTAVSRSAAGAALPTGVVAVPGDLQDPQAIAALVTDDIDAVVHTAAPLGEAELPLIDALADALAGSGRPLLWTSGVWVLGRTGDTPADEDSPVAPIAITGPRARIEARVLAAAERDVRAVVVRPGVVHGRGVGIPAMLVDWARTLGHGRWVGGATSPRWPLVDVEDLAELYVLASTGASAGTVLHGIAEPGVPAEALARAAATGAGVEPTAVAWPEAEAAADLGAPFAEALGLDQVVTAERARALGWVPTRPSAVDDLATGSYARVTA